MFVLKKDEIETFDFKIDGSKKTYKVPLLRYMPLGKALEAQGLQNATNEEAMLFIKGIFDEHAPGVSDSLLGSEFKTLTDAYFAESGVDLGE